MAANFMSLRIDSFGKFGIHGGILAKLEKRLLLHHADLKFPRFFPVYFGFGPSSKEIATLFSSTPYCSSR